MTTLGESAPAQSAELRGIGERQLIERIRGRLPAPPASVLVPIGDDAAVMQPDRGALHVLTADALVEGVHFDWRFSSPSDVGYKSLAVNLSDIAAMGATPRFALLSLMLPASLSLARIDGILDGLVEGASSHDVHIVGGNITRTPGPLVIDITLVGAVRPRRVLTRAGGQAGDALFVTGTIGAAVAGLGWLRTNGMTGLEHPVDAGLAECVQRHRRPEPRSRLGSLLGRNRAARACMDLSDGLADAVRQVAHASGTGARLNAETLPVHGAARAWFESQGIDPVKASLEGGDDYELLVAVPKRARGRLRHVVQQGRGVALTKIGELTKERDLVLERRGAVEELPSGFAHF